MTNLGKSPGSYSRVFNVHVFEIKMIHIYRNAHITHVCVTITFFFHFCRDVFHVPSIVAIATSACIILLNCNSREPLYILDFQGELLCNVVKLILTMSVTLFLKQLPLVLDTYILISFEQ